MRFPTGFLDDIRARVPISEVIGARVRFDPKKSTPSRGDYWACCPFHGEKTPSFHCEDKRGRYYCFGCGATGDIFRFLTELDGLSFHEAVERLAAQAGLALPKPDAQTEKREQMRANLYDVMEQAARFFEQNLQADKAPESAAARAYLQSRGLSLATQKQFRLGFASDVSGGLSSFLRRQAINDDLLRASGLFSESNKGSGFYERFRNRIIFPIADIRGRIIAFGGRALNSDALAKYINSPETELFHKGRIIYNLAQARQNLHGGRQADRAAEQGGSQAEGGQSPQAQGGDSPNRLSPQARHLIVVEGYIDVIALAQAGFGTATAPLGTALTEDQLRLLWQIEPQPILCFDGDKAGHMAAYRALDRALPLLKTGISLQFMLLPEGQDPDDIIRGEGRAAFADYMAQALPLMDILWQRETEGRNFAAPESRAALEKRLREAAAAIQDSSLRHYYLQDIKQRLWAYFRQASGGAAAVRGSAKGRAGGGYAAGGGQGGSLITKTLSDSVFVRSMRGAGGKGGIPPRDAAILALLAAQPMLWHEDFDNLAQLHFQNAALNNLHRAMVEILAEAENTAKNAADGELFPPVSAEFLRQKLEQKGQKEILDKITALTANLGVKDLLPSASPIQTRKVLDQALALYRRAHFLDKQIKEIEADLLENATSQGFARLRLLRETLRRAETLEAAGDDAAG